MDNEKRICISSAATRIQNSVAHGYGISQIFRENNERAHKWPFKDITHQIIAVAGLGALGVYAYTQANHMPGLPTPVQIVSGIAYVLPVASTTPFPSGTDVDIRTTVRLLKSDDIPPGAEGTTAVIWHDKKTGKEIGHRYNP
ncbi:hypothetical protein COU88_02245 [Candidatus Roizmanbacteria bacterium CG10_big_fil_rev_8_21_14_0_10_39_6]|uniref:Uncharacterized protein n=1 Tax=Candidatus Roizmanbacteria bacterium CG10_big_fil_rev_8_21_14_0_10_39_6 TaxID=1974853 RepID=A0A2M8KSR2_9BACT|nr:MAG: hypothetical protein COU88_02245 [Candidatus Roizmanbacteria bacterium CG10_big_fil_rev_8_21_14_0_10_39_6]